MKSFITLLVFTTLLFSCQTQVREDGSLSSKEKIAYLMADLSPRDGKIFFFTAVTRKQYRSKEIEACRQEGAAQLSRYIAVNGVSYIKTVSLNSNTRILEAGEIAYNSDLASSLEKDLILEEEIRTSEGTCALFSYPAENPPSYPYKPFYQKDAPEWTNQSLKLDKFQASVGFTGPKRFLERTIQQADRNALATLLEQRTGSIEATQSDWQQNTNTQTGSIMTEKSSGTIRGAYILSRWQDEKGNMYTLILSPLPGKTGTE